MEEIIEVQRGQKIINQGELGQGFFILQSGAVEVIKDEVLLSVIYTPGHFFWRDGRLSGKTTDLLGGGKEAEQDYPYQRG